MSPPGQAKYKTFCSWVLSANHYITMISDNNERKEHKWSILPFHFQSAFQSYQTIGILFAPVPLGWYCCARLYRECLCRAWSSTSKQLYPYPGLHGDYEIEKDGKGIFVTPKAMNGKVLRGGLQISNFFWWRSNYQLEYWKLSRNAMALLSLPLCNWLCRTLHHTINQSDAKLKPTTTYHTHFSPLQAGHVYISGVFIGSL